MTLFRRQRFAALWQRSADNFDAAQCDRVFDSLTALYADKTRHYHSAEHIDQCLGKMDEIAESTGYFSDVELAIWFHDAIYRAGDPENEQKSAEWFVAQMETHLGLETLKNVSQLIQTTDHKQTPATEQEQILIDIDLSSFSMPRPQFISDGIKIRNEFADFSDHDFIQGQCKFLQKLLLRSTIYSTRYFLSRHEKDARNNISYLLEVYQSGNPPWQNLQPA